ncbi:endo-beta-N-acetylglucosaminidase [Alistipes sp. An54]|uniref:BT_3987 domain-containing protein n=1 Tax=Alistipes sp. An54 TaxID=1965645 RepID=UPI000B392B9F|nr:DUF1735 domain-containing protein [Alistipes sp. An54]OUN76693.1 endo-beta-N-acetylglucosaminidase [Alistipes sp. An54]
MNIRYFKFRLLAVAAVLGCTVLGAACSDEIVAGDPVDEAPYQTIYETNGFLLDQQSNQSVVTIAPTGKEYTATLAFGVTRSAAGAISATAALDKAWLDTYNSANETAYVLYPEALVSFANGGSFTFDEEDASRATVDMTVAPCDTLRAGVTYAIPVAVSAEGISLKENASHCLYLINGDSEQADNFFNCNKGDDKPKAFLFFEVNGTNPLNALSFRLENGKLLWDAVVLFAANINWDAAAGRAYVNCNPNVQFLLDNNETFLQPLRKRGIKVLLGLLGNHDQAGLAQLSDIGARDFAAEVAEYVYAYNLDGVNYDDEYSTSPDLSNPYFTSRSSQAAARLCYETKKVMPDKLVTVFDYGSMYGVGEVDGVDADEWIDVVVANYGGYSSPVGDMGYDKCSGVSIEFNLGISSLTTTTAQRILSSGYGWFMGFALAPENFATSYSRLSGCETLYGSPLLYPTTFYKKNDTKPYVYPDELE